MQPCGMDIAKCANITIRDFKIVTMSRAAPAISRIDADRCRFIASISGAARTTKIILAHFIIPSTERIFSGIFVEYFRKEQHIFPCFLRVLDFTIDFLASARMRGDL
jgi:hypothetical protein